MPPRHGPPQPGAKARPANEAPARTEEEKRLQRERAERIRLLTASLPPSWSKRVRALQASGLSGAEALEVDYAVTATARERFIGAYEADRSAEAERRAQARKLRRGVAKLDADNPTRLDAEELAHSLDAARVDHAKAMQIIALLTDAARKAQDSLAVHRPSGHTRVHIEVISGGVRVGGSGPAETYHAGMTDEDEALRREVEGAYDTTADPLAEPPAP